MAQHGQVDPGLQALISQLVQDEASQFVGPPSALAGQQGPPLQQVSQQPFAPGVQPLDKFGGLLEMLLGGGQDILARGAAGLKEAGRSDSILAALTGSSDLAREQTIQAGKAPIPTDLLNTSAPLHSLTSEQISDTFGPDVAAGLGLLNEGFTGLGDKLTDRDFVNPGSGERGFSLQDLRSNFAGQRSSVQKGGSKEGGLSNIIGFINELVLEDENSGQELLGGKNIMDALRSLIGIPNVQG